MFNSDPVLKFEKLLTPISEEKPCGEPASDEQFEFVLKSCLLQATDEIKSGITEPVEKSLKDAISELDKCYRGKTKDLSYLRYYLLFVFWQHQFTGLRDGISFAKQLLEKFWDDLHPVFFESRIKEFQRQLPFYDGDEFALLVLNRIKMDEDGSFIASHLINSEDTPNNELTDYIKKKHSENGEFYEVTINTLDSILEMATETDEIIRTRLDESRTSWATKISNGEVPAFEGEEPLAAGSEDAKDAASSFLMRTEKMLNPYQTVLDQDFRDRLEKFRNLLLANVRLQQPDFMMELTEEESSDESAGGENSGGGSGGGGSVNNRMAALGQLEKVAQYFELNEPHSPIPYALREIKLWGDLSYPELLHRLAENMVEDESAFKTISRRLNFPWPVEEDRY